MRVLEKIVDSFLLRNATLFVLLHGPSFFQRIALKKGTIILLESITLYVLFYLLCMFHNLVLYKRFLLKRKYMTYVMLLFISITIFQALLLAEERYVSHRPFPPHTFAVWMSIYAVDLSYIFLGFCIFYSFDHYKTKHNILKLQYLRRDLELKQLKEQLNPHFLFNALNNIYSYSLERNSYSKELILKLSELMRFIVTNSDKNRIFLLEECKFIEHYIAFEKERLGDLCDINYSVDIAGEGVEVAPFILFALVENAFKHGTHSTERSTVSISISADDRVIQLQTANLIMEPASPGTTGTGLVNTGRRLELLYPQKHSLKTEAANGIFTAKLSINLQENGH